MAVLAATLLALPFAAWLALARFPGRQGVIAILNGMMGLPPVTELATGFRGGVAVKVHDCVTIGCQGWHDQSDTFWGMGVLRGRDGGEPLTALAGAGGGGGEMRTE